MTLHGYCVDTLKQLVAVFGDNSTANQYGVSSSGPSMQPCGEPGVLHKAHGIQDSITKYI